MIEGGGLGVVAPGRGRAHVDVQVREQGGGSARPGRSRRRGRGAALPLVLPPRAVPRGLAERRPAGAAPPHPGEPGTQLRRAAGHRGAVRHRQRARAARRVRRRGDHRAGAHRRARALGLLANNPRHLGGAIDGDAADKAARVPAAVRARTGCPIVSLVDTPGFMVGPEAERTGASCAAFGAMFVAGAGLTVPVCAVVLRKGLRPRARWRWRAATLRRPAHHRGLADRRVRRHGPRGRGAARLPQRARGDRGSGERARARFEEMVAEHVRARQGGQHRDARSRSTT